MAASTKTRPGTQAKVRYVRMSASKARVVLNLIRGKQVTEAAEILQFSERLAAQVIAKALKSAVANAEHNEDLSEDDLFVSACYADEGPTLKRFRPRARGRAGRIHKQTCHIVVEVSRMTEEELDVMRTSAELKDANRSSKSKTASDAGGDRAKRVAKSKAAAEPEEVTDEVEDELTDDVVEADEATEAAAEAPDSDAEAANEGATDEVEAEVEPEVADATSSDDGADDAGEKQ